MFRNLMVLIKEIENIEARKRKQLADSSGYNYNKEVNLVNIETFCTNSKIQTYEEGIRPTNYIFFNWLKFWNLLRRHLT